MQVKASKFSAIFITFGKNMKLWDVQVVAAEEELLEAVKTMEPVVLADAINLAFLIG